MANYCCATRTNYFHVKDRDKFIELMDRVYGCEDSVDVWEDKDEEGKTVFGFGLYSGIAGLRDDNMDVEDEDIEDECGDYDKFIEGLQECVADDDAVIIFEAGNEKLRYVIGAAEIITSKEYKRIGIQEIASQMAAQILGNPSWKTKCYY